MAATHSGLQGLSFFKKPQVANLFGAIAAIGAYVWFFAIDNRNVPGLEGSQQFGNFTLGVFLAIVFTLVVSSLLRANMNPRPSESDEGQGLDALRGMTYFQAMKRATLRLLRFLRSR
ncbi:MAG: hypothetical protein A2Y60_02165 [Chloroflexi bacterium RBG_13_54_9]|nr:MAG: hypothetical protein A2Y60_02165 [Chloroflexi bacterium RBG_13_54_9]